MRYIIGLLPFALATFAYGQSLVTTPSPEWTTCGAEEAICAAPPGSLVRYGASARYVYRIADGAIGCNNRVFGDPVVGIVKSCAIANPAAGPAPTPTTSPTPVPAPGPDGSLRSRLGVNVAPVIYWSQEQSFANLAIASEWRDPVAGWTYVDTTKLRDGLPAAIVPGRPLTTFLTTPVGAYRGEDATTRCTWAGTGRIGISGARRIVGQDAQSITFSWPLVTTAGAVRLDLIATSPADRVRDLDCRLTTDTPNAVYAAQLLDYLRPFGVLRFLDWSNANGNPAAVTWATRGQPRGLSIGGSDGIALEHQIGLANAVAASPWFTVPLNADADYQRRMAQMVHDHIPAGRPVYVELSNETWNYQFDQSHQLQKEGVAARLSNNPFQAAQYRYAQRIIDMMAVWSEVYADRPADLVRVVGTQAGNPWVGEIIMDWQGGRLRSSVDAIAIAPYFTVSLASGGDVMTRLGEAARSQIAREATAYATLAKRTGKRLIAYEAGQHLIDPARLDAMKAANRDPRMEGIYRDYIAAWQAVSGDLMVMYAATSPITGSGAWGLREYAGQPIAETPKLRGVLR